MRVEGGKRRPGFQAVGVQGPLAPQVGTLFALSLFREGKQRQRSPRGTGGPPAAGPE